MTSFDLIAVFLGDASPRAPYARLQMALAGTSRSVVCGPVERWVSLLCAPDEAAATLTTLSTKWPCVHVAAVDEGAAFSLYREGGGSTASRPHAVSTAIPSSGWRSSARPATRCVSR